MSTAASIVELRVNNSKKISLDLNSEKEECSPLSC